MSGVEMVAGAIVEHVAGKLGGIAWERLQLLWNFKEDAEEMESKMVDLQVALSYVDKRSRETDDASVQHWLKKYKSVAYDIEDALDELVANAMIWQNSPCTAKMFFSSINPLIVRITVSNKMRNIRVRLNKIGEDQKKFPLLSWPTPAGQERNKEQRETFIGEREEIEMVGREREKNYILIKVLQKDGDQESSIIPVVGLGGMGKTTLVKSVYNDKQILTKFDVKAWVHVSKDFDLHKIVSDIICQVEGTTTPANDARLQFLKSQLDHILSNKIYLIVLDDLWEEGRSKLEDLVKMLQSGNKGGNAIIVTTRSEKVTSTLCNMHSSYFHIVDPVILKGMSTDKCWSIMKPRNLGNRQLADLEYIGKEIARLCSGVPLVATALGYVMQKHCTREEWLKMKNVNILDIEGDDKGVLKGLLLSYYHMPPELKLCFIYCSIFPKSHDIDHDCLIQQWIALGFIQDTDGKSLQKIGWEYINELLRMSFLTISSSPTVLAARIFEPALRLRMHDVVHDLARHVAADEFSYTNGAANNTTKRDKSNCHYLLLINQNDTSSTYKTIPKKVRALHSRGCDKIHLLEQAFSHTLCLRVLDLSGFHVSDLPGSDGKLKLLRYLDASNLPISRLPKSLTRLLNLQTLILSRSSLKTLPTNIGFLQNLQYFDLSGCINLCELPISFGNLSALLFLNLASCHELLTFPESFGKLHRLQYLNLSDCYKLHSLPESCCQLHDLTHLDLSDCHNLEKLPDCIGQLSKLEYLNMTSCSKVQMLPDSLCKLTMLKHLDLSFCVKLEHLPSSIGDLRLRRLNLECCFFLSDLPDSILSMSTLVHIENVQITMPNVNSKLEKLREKLSLKGSFELDGGSCNLWSQITELEKAPCYELLITGLKNVKRFEGAEQAKLSNNNSNLTRLILGWDHVGSVMPTDAAADKAVLEKLLPPRSLQHLFLYGYMSRDLPRWVLDIPSYLPHLTTIFLVNLKGCSHLPPLGRLPNLRALYVKGMPNIKSVGRGFYGDYGSCQKLRVIGLQSMNNLKEWWTTRSSNEDGEFLIPNLHMLHACDCPKLKFLPYPPRSMIWVVKNSDHVLPENGFRNLSSTTSPFYLEVIGAPPSCEVWRRAHQYLSSVSILNLTNMTGLGTLLEATRGFPSLWKLEVEDCDDLETLPEWLGGLTLLREVLIKKCPKVSSLPESIQRLTELKKLQIIDCPSLSEKCQGEDKRKIAHIPQVKFE